VDYLWSPWRYRYLTHAREQQGCIFCEMAADNGAGQNHDEQNLIVHRGKYNFVVLNRYP
jgi:ATP adenylyltransferase